MQSAFIDSENEDDSDVSILAKISNIKPEPKPHSAKVPRPEHEQTPEAKPQSKPCSANLKVPKVENASLAANIVRVGTSDINTLPAFACSTWSSIFLPTLYN